MWRHYHKNFFLQDDQVREAKEFRRRQAAGQFNKTYNKPSADREAYHAYDREQREARAHRE